MLDFNLDALEDEIDNTDFLAQLDEIEQIEKMFQKNNLELKNDELNDMLREEIFSSLI